MGRRVLCNRWSIGLLFLVLLLTGLAYADDSSDKKPDHATIKEVEDCRYQQSAESTDEETASGMFPADDVFRPLLADPRQPHFFALWQSTQSRLERTNANIGSIGIGENFGFYTRRKGCNGWQISLLTGIFAQFDLDASNAALINVDFNVGVPLTWRHGNWSARLRFYHQSSHVGDEFLGANPGFQSIGLQYEEVDMIASYDFRRWLRLYGGGAVLVNRQPSTIDRLTGQWGFEARTPTPLGRSYLFGLLSNPILFTPVLTADFKSVEEQKWYINTNFLMGFDMSRTGYLKRLRILFNYYHGYNPYGQFFYSQKTESFGAGAYFMF
ncbi:MAG TPA: DUF1207 domain-containing protein [Nitrospira sp.]|nr:DUF1207 domain-containing protein [Nitrospira sp.]